MTTDNPATLITNVTIVCCDDRQRIVPRGALLIEGGFIRRIGSEAALRRVYRGPRSGVLDGGGRLVLPGFINAHAHLYGVFARGMAVPGRPPRNFLEILQKLWWKLDKALDEEAVYWSAMVGLMQAIRRGTTTVIDHHASPRAVAGSLDALWRAFARTGVRGALCYEVSDRDGPQVARQGIAENIRFLQLCRKDSAGEMRAALFGLHASFTLTDRTLKACAEAGHAMGAGFHIHCAEDPCDNRISRSRFGRRPLERLAAAGMLNSRTILAHCIHIGDRDRDLIAGHDCLVAHNPRSNMNNAVGVADIRALMDRGITVGLGTDGVSFSQQEEILAAFLLHKIHRGDCNFGWVETWAAAVGGNQQFARRVFGIPGLGALVSGAPADLVLLDYFPPTPLTADSLKGHLFFGILYAPVFATIIGGRVRMWGGALVGLDEEDIAHRAARSARRVWKRVQA
ncbi:MAG: putative aminohydrolase SsnA [Candidatus Sumerlaeia bacterium]